MYIYTYVYQNKYRVHLYAGYATYNSACQVYVRRVDH